MRHYAVAEITVAGETLQGVPCRIELPERVDGKPELLFQPPAPLAFKIMQHFKMSCREEIKDVLGKCTMVVECAELYQKGTIQDGAGISIETDARDLLVTHPNSADNERPSRLYFWISQNPDLGPGKVAIFHTDGTVEMTGGHRAVCALGDLGDVRFDIHYSGRAGEQVIERWGHHVAELDYPRSSLDRQAIGELASALDDVLVLTSLASSVPTAWIGWDLCAPELLASYYRRDIDLRDFGPRGRERSRVIDPERLDAFLNQAYAVLHGVPSKRLIHSAIWCSLPTGEPVEPSYLSMFSMLEALAFAGRDRTIVTDNRWPALRNAVRSAIRNHAHLEPDERTKIEAKLPEFNRPAFRDVWHAFVDEAELDIDDLWPVIGKSPTDLLTIRNKLAHGELLSGEALIAVGVAVMHLRAVLQRMILATLKFPLGRSNLSKEKASIVWPALATHVIRRYQEVLGQSWSAH